MKIILNGQEADVPDRVTIARLLDENGLDPRHVVVEIDRNIIPFEAFETTSLKEGTVLEVLRFVGGG